MDNDVAETLATFRANLERLSLEQLGQVCADTLGELCSFLRVLDPGSYGIEVAEALAAELHRRNLSPTIRAPTIGHA